ncbi:hypothetical protein NE865_11493 [Phthorimaea operculella]|nr:hypothetical protein NE865_11493 [Phthorimaea operculella]
MHFDLVCANVDEKRFKSTLNKEHRESWRCAECIGTRSVPETGTLAVQQTIDINKTGRENVTIRGQQRTDKQSAPSVPKLDQTELMQDDNYESFLAAISSRVLLVIRAELPSMISAVVKREIGPVKEELQQIGKSIQFLSDSYEEMKKSIAELTKDNKELKQENEDMKSSITDLTNRLNNVEQHLRDNNLEMHGIPEHRNENLMGLLKNCSTTIGCGLNDDDIIQCTRVAKMNKESKYPRSVVVKFKTQRKRDEFYSAVYRYNKSKPGDKLNSSVFGISGEKHPIYVSEHLSPANKNLHAAARKKAKQLGYKFTWVRNGRIYVRKDPDSSFILIKNLDSLELIR